MIVVICSGLCGAAAAAELPPGFIEQPIGASWSSPLGIAFDASAPNNRLYVWERAGKVWIVENGRKSAGPLIDLSDEVMAWRDLGLLSVALDPRFHENGFIYLLYAVDRHHLLHFGTADYDAATNLYTAPTIGRLTRYTACAEDGFRTIDPGSRRVLIGESINRGVPILHDSHGVGALAFGRDGTLLVSCGDGASYYAMDDGGADGGSLANQAESDGIIAGKENVGAFRAQLLDSLNGKILRIDPQTGDGLPGNPYFDSAKPRSARSRVWALGFRNPFRMTVRPGSGSAFRTDADPGVIYVGDVGAGTWEELDVITRPGTNCGWPLFEGLDPQPEYQASPAVNLDAPNPVAGHFRFRDLIVQETTASPPWLNPLNRAQRIPSTLPHWMHARPIIDYQHASNGSARTGVFKGQSAAVSILGSADCPVAATSFTGRTATAGVFFSSDDFPPEYRGAFFHADFAAGWIKAMTVDDADRPRKIRPFASGTGPIVFLGTHPTSGALYYVTFNGKVRRIIHAPAGNQAPVAIATVSRNFGPAPLTVQFDGAASFDREGAAVEYWWVFDDGSTSREPMPVKTYSADGTRKFEATLRVTDSFGASSETIRIPIFVNHAPPIVSVISPRDGAQYPVGATSLIPLRATIQPRAGHAASSWWQTMVHEGGRVRVAPPVPGLDASLVVQGEGAGSFYENVFTVVDDLGLEVTERVRLRPALSDHPPKLAWSTPDKEIAAGAITLLDPAALVTDDDSPGLEEGTLTIDLLGGTSAETLGLQNDSASAFEVETDDGQLRFRGVSIGTFHLGNGHFPLIVTFNAAATPAAATAVLRHVTYRSSVAMESPRMVRATLTDGDGGTAVAADLVLALRAGNLSPSVQLIAPAPGVLLEKHAKLALEARVSDPDDGIARVDFFRGGTKLGSVNAPPHTFIWTDLPAGNFQLRARAVDRSGATQWSAPVAVQVSPPTARFFADNFNDRHPEGRRWSSGSIIGSLLGEAGGIDPAIRAIATNDHLEIALPPEMEGPRYGGYVVRRARDLTDASASIEIVQAAAGAADTRFAVSKDAENAIVMFVRNGSLHLDQIVNGRRNLTGIPYAPAQHRYWRIRHASGAPATIAFEVSRDRLTWQLVRRDEAQFALDRVRPELSAGTWQTEPAPGVAMFDNFKIARTAGADFAEPINEAPYAKISAPYAAAVNVPVSLSAAASVDPDGAIVSVQWKFSDGSTAFGMNVAKSFRAPGIYPITVRVTDDDGAFSEESASVTVEDAASTLSAPQ